jgi:hypothetical protein
MLIEIHDNFRLHAIFLNDKPVNGSAKFVDVVDVRGFVPLHLQDLI